MKKFTIRPLSAARVTQAYPLLHTAQPELTLAAWRDFAASLMSGGNAPGSVQGDVQGDARPGGILAATDARGTITGLCCYRLTPDLVHGRRLDADHFLAFDIFDRRPVAEALAAAVEALAREHGCSAVHTHLPYRHPPDGDAAPPGPGSGLSSLLAARGHRVESLGLCKRLGA